MVKSMLPAMKKKKSGITNGTVSIFEDIVKNMRRKLIPILLG